MATITIPAKMAMIPTTRRISRRVNPVVNFGLETESTTGVRPLGFCFGDIEIRFKKLINYLITNIIIT
jgi:hypothetical protein